MLALLEYVVDIVILGPDVHPDAGDCCRAPYNVRFTILWNGGDIYNSKILFTIAQRFMCEAAWPNG